MDGKAGDKMTDARGHNAVNKTHADAALSRRCFEEHMRCCEERMATNNKEVAKIIIKEVNADSIRRELSRGKPSVSLPILYGRNPSSTSNLGFS